MHKYYNRQSQPIDQNEYVTLFSNWEYKRIARTQVTPDVLVSTVWLGLNHAFHETQLPLIFESLVMGGDSDNEMRRYSFEEDARLGHWEMVVEELEKVIKGLTPEELKSLQLSWALDGFFLDDALLALAEQYRDLPPERIRRILELQQKVWEGERPWGGGR